MLQKTEIGFGQCCLLFLRKTSKSRSEIKWYASFCLIENFRKDELRIFRIFKFFHFVLFPSSVGSIVSKVDHSITAYALNCAHSDGFV